MSGLNGKKLFYRNISPETLVGTTLTTLTQILQHQSRLAFECVRVGISNPDSQFVSTPRRATQRIGLENVRVVSGLQTTLTVLQWKE